MVCRFIACVALLTQIGTAAADERPWAWVATVNAITHWDASQGKASVSIEGEHFTAQLFRGDYPEQLAITLKGTIRNSRITVNETVWATDHGGGAFSGTYKLRRFKGFADTGGVEIVSLTDGIGWIGLTRSLPK